MRGLLKDQPSVAKLKSAISVAKWKYDGYNNPRLHLKSGHSSVGRASASQAEGRGSESRCPLQNIKGFTDFAVSPFSLGL